jgi:hypothetical protein
MTILFFAIPTHCERMLYIRRGIEYGIWRFILCAQRACARLGFNVQLLGSWQYVHAKLEALNQCELATVKEAFMGNRHQRFLKKFSSHLPFGRTEAYKREVENANLEKLAGLIKICSFLLQTKVYLFWSRP